MDSEKATMRARLQRFVSCVVNSLKRKFYYCNKEDTYGNDFKRYAKQLGVTVVRCDDATRDYSLLDRVVYPLTNPKEEQAKAQQDQCGLDTGCNRDRCNQPSTSHDSQCVPPVFNFQVGKRVSHLLRVPEGDERFFRPRGSKWLMPSDEMRESMQVAWNDVFGSS